MDSEKKIIGRCPFCGGNVVKTCKGYRCENNTGEHPSCVLNINAIIGNRKMNDGEIAEFLEKRRILLAGERPDFQLVYGRRPIALPLALSLG